jgi:Tfp pilus assembly protein PilE
MVHRAKVLAGLLVLLVLGGCRTYTTGLQQSVERADEAVAMSAMRSIALAQRAYSLSNGGEYGTLAQLTEGGYLDARYKSDNAVKDYVLTLKVTPKAADSPEGSYTCNADPSTTGAMAGRHFYIDSTSLDIHVNATQPASASDPAIQ